MTKRLLYGFLGIVLVSTSIFLVALVVFLISSEVLPAVRQGSLSVDTSSLILNHLWEGNEIYVLVSAYLLIACASAYGAIYSGFTAIGR